MTNSITKTNNNNETLKGKMLALLTAYLAYAFGVNVHQTPKKGINSGAEGRAFERAINYMFGLLKRSGAVQGANSFDCIKYRTVNGKRKRITIEIKTGSGTLGILDANGNIISSPLLKSDFIAYVPQLLDGIPAEKQVLFFETSVFIDILKKNNLIRKKASGKMTARKKAGLNWYYDVLSIQSFKNSKKRFTAFTNDLFFEGLTFDDFVNYYGISIG